MGTVIVVGSINHDRIWSLATPLLPGARIKVADRSTRLGGGGFYTSVQLAGLGHDVRLISQLMNDSVGQDALLTLASIGIETRYVTVRAGETVSQEILLEPNGERTILTIGKTVRPAFTVAEMITADAAYLNALTLEANLVACLEQVPLVMSQLPLQSATPRPADIVIGSRADFPGEAIHDLWERARLIAGTRLKSLVLTDGSRPILLYDGSCAFHVAPSKQLSVRDTIGAGDSFAGVLLHGLLQGLNLSDAATAASQRTADWLSERAERLDQN